MSERAATAGERVSGEEHDLARRLRHGDRRALETVMERHGEGLLRYLNALVQRREEAEDLFQETWVRVMEQAASYDPDRPFAPWLYRIARNLALDRMRWFGRWRLIGFAAEPEDAQAGAVPDPSLPATAEDGLVSRELAHRLLASLDARSREVLWLRFWGDLAYEEIAAVCRVPVGTVKSRLARALLRVGRRWAELEGRAHATHELAL